jgi:hypothetical protein
MLTFHLNLCSCVQHNKMSRKSCERNESNVDRMEQYKFVLSELLSKKDDSFSNGVSKETLDTKIQNKGKHGHTFNGSFPLFFEQINGLTKNDKKRLKHTLNEVITFLNADVDEVKTEHHSLVLTCYFSRNPFNVFLKLCIHFH